MISLIKKIVFSGVDGRVLIIPLILVIYVAVGQAREFIGMAKEIFREVKLKEQIEKTFQPPTEKVK